MRQDFVPAFLDNSGCNARVDTGRNLALRKPANASSTYKGSFQIWASNVVDGSPSGNFFDLTCHSVESGDLNPWWQVDLQTVYRITRVQIIGRSDCCAKRLYNFSIEMYLEEPSLSVSVQPRLCHYNKGVFRPTTQDIKCDSVVAGRFVRLSRKVTQHPEPPLALCEVSVFGPDTYAADFRVTNLSLTDTIVLTLPLGILHCGVICTTNPLCMAVKVVNVGTPVCQLVYKSVHRSRGTTLTLLNFFVPTSAGNPDV
ncbi:fucolectin-like [Haliotis asinina]|uniref:fucolectin-like n=1 Tax=Haliotis asinina TaxID=109174 RepID=UPI0035319743